MVVNFGYGESENLFHAVPEIAGGNIADRHKGSICRNIGAAICDNRGIHHRSGDGRFNGITEHHIAFNFFKAF